MNQELRQTISDRTGFDAGDEWESKQAVRDYFQREELAGCLNSQECIDALPDQATLDDYADAVIENRWHCAF